MEPTFRRRLAAVVAALALLVLGTSVAAAGPAGPGPDGSVGAQPPLSAENARLAAEALKVPAVQAFQQTVRAVVTGTGGLVAAQSFGAVSAARADLPTGTYQVCFNVVVTNGTYVASLGLPGNVGFSAPGEVTVIGRFQTNNCLFIQTYTSAGALADRGFHVIVMF